MLGATRQKTIPPYKDLHHAAEEGDVEAICKMVGSGQYPVDISKRDRLYSTTPLFMAALCGHAAAVKALVWLGADRDKANDRGTTPILIAVENGHGAVVQALLELKANPDTADNNGDTPIFWAAFHGYVAIVRALLESNAKSDILNNSGWSPLFVAAMNGHGAVLQALLEFNAKLSTRDCKIALRQSYPEIAGLLSRFLYLETHAVKPNTKAKEIVLALGLQNKRLPFKDTTPVYDERYYEKGLLERCKSELIRNNRYVFLEPTVTISLVTDSEDEATNNSFSNSFTPRI